MRREKTGRDLRVLATYLFVAGYSFRAETEGKMNDVVKPEVQIYNSEKSI